MVVLLVSCWLICTVTAGSNFTDYSDNNNDSIIIKPKCCKGKGNITESTDTVLSSKSQNNTNEGNEKNNGSFTVLTSGEIHRQRIIVSGYLIFGVVCVGLTFLGVTHFLGRREVRKYQKKFGLSYAPARKETFRQV